MGIFSSIFNRSAEEDSIPFDAYKKEVKGNTADSEEDPTAGCNRCKNKQDGFCKGKSFRCEAFSLVIEE